ncbi:YegP family protein [Pseudarthrobacter sp. H2]|uniref:YegP family protein n=1 Tax=Pseudarthrobacter sp. H2 TaxID=3418415 RepID=UPI003CF80470
MFEVFIDEDECFRFRLKAPDGTVVAVSRSFPDKPAAVSGISAVREYAGMGLITDLCPEVPVHGSSAAPPAPDTRQATRSPADRPVGAPRRASATGSYRPAAPRRVPVGSGLHKVA